MLTGLDQAASQNMKDLIKKNPKTKNYFVGPAHLKAQ